MFVKSIKSGKVDTLLLSVRAWWVGSSIFKKLFAQYADWGFSHPQLRRSQELSGKFLISFGAR